MQKLDSNWLVSGLVDFEYKKYTLLAYLQSVDNRFGSYCLFPDLSDLIAHYDEIRLFIERKEGLNEHFPKEAVKVDFAKLDFEYRKLFEDDEVIRIIEKVALYAKPLFEKGIGRGKDLYNEVEQQMGLYPVGISPLNKDEGYLLILMETSAELKIYRYAMSLFESSGAQYRALHTKFMEQRKLSPWHSLESVKLNLLKSYPDLPNPATYVVEVPKKLPEDETVLPVAKRLLVRCLSEAA